MHTPWKHLPRSNIGSHLCCPFERWGSVFTKLTSLANLSTFSAPSWDLSASKLMWFCKSFRSAKFVEMTVDILCVKCFSLPSHSPPKHRQAPIELEAWTPRYSTLSQLSIPTIDERRTRDLKYNQWHITGSAKHVFNAQEMTFKIMKTKLHFFFSHKNIATVKFLWPTARLTERFPVKLFHQCPVLRASIIYYEYTDFLISVQLTLESQGKFRLWDVM